MTWRWTGMAVLSFTCLWLSLAEAKDNEDRKTKINDSTWGEFILQVKDEKEPVTQPYKLDLSILCKDQRTRRSAVQPVVENVLSEKVCEYRGYTFDEKALLLTLHYSTLSETQPGDVLASCGDDWSQAFDLRLLCGQWKP